MFYGQLRITQITTRSAVMLKPSLEAPTNAVALSRGPLICRRSIAALNSVRLLPTFFPSAYSVMGFSGFIEVVGLTVWGYELFANMRAGKKLERESSAFDRNSNVRFQMGVTSRRGNSRNSSRPNSARRSDHCASLSEGDGAHKMRAVFHRHMRQHPFRSNGREINEYKFERANGNPRRLSAGWR